MNFEKNDAIIGAFVLAAVAACILAAAALNRQRLPAEANHFEIRLPNIAGIDKGVEVIYQGYKAGAVDKVTIAYKPELLFIVGLAIKKEIRLKAGTTVVARNKGFGGAKVLELSMPPGGDSRRLLPEGAVLPAMRETDLMVKANEVMGEMERVARNFQKEGTSADIAQTFKRANAALAKLDVTLTNVNTLLEENRASLKATLHEAQGASARANESLARLPAIMADVSELIAELKRHPWRLLRKGEPSEKTPAAPAGQKN